MKIVVCEDNFVIALDLEGLVEDLGHKCCGIASRSDEALQMAEEEGADLVLVDLDLADGPTGLDLVDALAARNIPSIIVSGQPTRVGEGHAANAVLPKPVNKPLLCKKIAEIAPQQGVPAQHLQRTGCD